MKTKLALLLFATMAFAIQCKKNEYTPTDTTTIKGYLVDVSNREPLANGKVVLIKSYIPSPGSMICCYQTRNVLHTDDNGWFDYSFKHNPDSLYDIACVVDGYTTNYLVGPSNSFYPLCISGMEGIKKGFTNIYSDQKRCSGTDTKDQDVGILRYPEIRLAPFGEVRVRVVNVPPANNSDQLFLRLEDTPISARTVHNGAVVDDYVTGNVRGNRYSKITWSKTINGIFSYHEDSVYVKKGETADYLLEY
jgi:hypothetical protein